MISDFPCINYSICITNTTGCLKNKSVISEFLTFCVIALVLWSSLKKLTTDEIIDALKLCQENNVFNFEDKLYKQKKGHATGQKQASPVAYGGAGAVERQFFDKPRDLVFDENPHIFSRPFCKL